MRGIERWGKVGVPLIETGLIIGGVLWWGYDNETRVSVKERDRWSCQIEGCTCEGKLTVHHTVPQCVLAKKVKPINGIYTNSLWRMHQYLERKFQGNEQLLKDVDSAIRCFVGSAENGITVCRDHHMQIHSDSLKDFWLKHNLYHQLRPPRMTIPYIQAMLVGQLAPILEEADIEPFDIWDEAVCETYFQLLNEGKMADDQFERLLDSYFQMDPKDFDYLRGVVGVEHMLVN